MNAFLKPKVIHIKDSQKHPDEVYIGRAGKGHDGTFGNPVIIGKKCPECGSTHHTAGDTLACYWFYLIRTIEQDPEFKQKVMDLKGKTLVCFCKPAPCHGDVLADMVMSLHMKEKNRA